MASDGRYEFMPKKEIARAEKEKRKLQKNLEGIRNMSRLPDALFVVDTRKEKIAVDEARKLKIPVIGVVDTNCDPDEVDFVIPERRRTAIDQVARLTDGRRRYRRTQPARNVWRIRPPPKQKQRPPKKASRTVRPADLRKPQRPAETQAQTPAPVPQA